MCIWVVLRIARLDCEAVLENVAGAVRRQNIALDEGMAELRLDKRGDARHTLPLLAMRRWRCMCIGRPSNTLFHAYPKCGLDSNIHFWLAIEGEIPVCIALHHIVRVWLPRADVEPPLRNI